MKERDDWDRHWFDLRQVTGFNPAQTYRQELIIHWLRQQALTGQSHLLDIGSGQGDLIANLARIFPVVKVAGVEMSAVGIEQSRIKTPQALFFQRDLTQPPVSDDDLLEWAEFAACSEVLEHVDEPEKLLTHAARYLAPGGRLFITVPGGPISAFDRHIGHRRHFTKDSLTRLIRDAGLIPERVSGVGFPFFNLYRMVVILRGKALIRDACGQENQQPSLLARVVMGAFSLVLKRALNSTSMGWQMTAQARKPASPGEEAT